MQRLVGVTLLALALVSMGGAPVAVASTVQGTAVAISGLDDLSATADSQARKGAGKVFAMLLGMGGLASILGGRIGLGLGGVGSGLAMGFVPGMVSSAFDSAPAATSALTQVAGSSAWWAPATVGLYPLFLALRIVHDPIVLVACLLGVGLARLVARQSPAAPGA